jgi:hypothetical protein
MLYNQSPLRLLLYNHVILNFHFKPFTKLNVKYRFSSQEDRNSTFGLIFFSCDKMLHLVIN